MATLVMSPDLLESPALRGDTVGGTRVGRGRERIVGWHCGEHVAIRCDRVRIDRQAGVGERSPQLAPSAVQARVEGAAGGAEPFGQYVDRDAVQGESREHLALSRRERRG